MINKSMINKIMKNEKMTFNKLRWSLIILFFIAIIFVDFNSNLPGISTLKSVIISSFIFIVAGLYGAERYGLKNITILFLITWIVSNFFEILSMHTGFPSGFYQYVNLPGPTLFGVPIIIMFTYFAMGYISWTLSHILTGQYSKKLQGKQIFIVPIVATFIMVMWDLIMDPVSSTLKSLWVWQSIGPYFGVPISNYVGWFLVVFIFFQIFAIYFSKYDTINPKKATIFSSKFFWSEMVVVYGIVALDAILRPVSDQNNITISLALITVFTMLFVVIISLITIANNRDLS
jgi:uncharacterized membrane protein